MSEFVRGYVPAAGPSPPRVARPRDPPSLADPGGVVLYAISKPSTCPCFDPPPTLVKVCVTLEDDWEDEAKYDPGTPRTRLKVCDERDPAKVHFEFPVLPDAVFTKLKSPIKWDDEAGTDFFGVALAFNKGDFLFEHKASAGKTYVLYFSSASAAGEYCSSLEAVRDYMDLSHPGDPESVAHHRFGTLDNLPKLMPHLKGELMVAKNERVQELYYTGWNGNGNFLSETLAKYRNSTVRSGSSKPAQDAKHFVQALSLLAESTMLRCAILCVKLQEDVVADFVTRVRKEKTTVPTGEHYVLFLKHAKKQLDSLKPRSKALFMYFVRYPYADRPDENEVVVDERVLDKIIAEIVDKIDKEPLCSDNDNIWFKGRANDSDRPSPMNAQAPACNFDMFMNLIGEKGLLQYCTKYLNYPRALGHMLRVITKEEIEADFQKGAGSEYMQLLLDVLPLPTFPAYMGYLYSILQGRMLVATDTFRDTLLAVGVAPRGLTKGVLGGNLVSLVNFMLYILYEEKKWANYKYMDWQIEPAPSLADKTVFTPLAYHHLGQSQAEFSLDFFSKIMAALDAHERDEKTGIPAGHDGLDCVVELLLCFGHQNELRSLKTWLSDIGAAATSAVPNVKGGAPKGLHSLGKAARVEMVKKLFSRINFYKGEHSHLYKMYRDTITEPKGPKEAHTFYRTREKLELVILGFIEVAIEVERADPTSASMVEDMLKSLNRWETELLPKCRDQEDPLERRASTPGKEKTLREKVVCAYKNVYTFLGEAHCSEFNAMMLDGRLLNKPSHFRREVFQALGKIKDFVAPNDLKLVVKLLAVAIHLDSDLENMASNAEDIWKICGGDTDLQRMLELIVDGTLERLSAPGSEDVFKAPAGSAPFISMKTVYECARTAAQARMLVADVGGNAGLAKRLEEIFKSYCATFHPSAWRAKFDRDAESVALFLKYIAQEDLEKAYRQFNSENRRQQAINMAGGASSLYERFEARVREIYPAQLVPFADLDPEKMRDADLTAITRKILGGGSNMPPLQKMLRQLTANYMNHTRDARGVAMVPRNAQLITCLTFAVWAEKKLAPVGTAQPGVPHTLVARVLTGEGKSLIIAMLCVLLVKLHGKSVHVLSSNEGLRDRDFEEFGPFFNLAGVQSSRDLGAAPSSAGQGLVVYCVKQDLDVYYFKNVGRKPFSNTVLVVDEVDSLIVDDAPNNPYLKKDDDMQIHVKRLFDDFLADGAALQSRDEPYYDVVREAVQLGNECFGKGRGQPGGYSTDSDGKFFAIDESGREQRCYSLAMEVRVTTLVWCVCHPLTPARAHSRHQWLSYKANHNMYTPVPSSTVFFASSPHSAHSLRCCVHSLSAGADMRLIV
jgi:SecA DEAD-like domain